MRRIILLSALIPLLLSLTIMPGFAQNRANTDTEFQSLTNRYYEAWSMQKQPFDIIPAAQFYAKDVDLIFFDVLEPLQGYRGWEAFQKNMIDNVYASLENFKLTGNDDLYVTRKGDIAWTTQTFHASGKLKNGKISEFNGRNTDIWERRDGAWLIVHEHGSVALKIEEQ